MTKPARPSVPRSCYQLVQIGAALRGITPFKWLIEAIEEKAEREKIQLPADRGAT